MTMEETGPPEPIVLAVPTADEAIAHAARILRAAEGELDRQMMERLTHMADVWVQVASIQAQREDLEDLEGLG